MKWYACLTVAVLMLVTCVAPCSAGDTGQLKALIKSMKAQGLDASQFEQMLEEEEAENTKSGYQSSEAKKNVFEERGYGWMTDCNSISETQLYTMCANANLQYLNYIKYIGTSDEEQAYKVHKMAAETAIEFYEQSKN